MGLFGKLFDKKECSVCGGEIGLLGNRKLEDGNLCKECAAKLSPWFSDRRQSTVAEIQEQLTYREANQAKVSSFRTTRTLGERTKVLLDEDAGLFMVTSARNWEEANPDVLSFSDVTGCKLDIDERRTEIEYRDKDGERQSFNPKRYAYSYDFYIVINVNNPYFSEIRFQLNSSSVDNDEETLLDGPNAMRRPRGGLRAKAGGMGGGSLTSNAEEVRSSVEYRQYEAGDGACAGSGGQLHGGLGGRPAAGAGGSGRGRSTQGGGDLSVLRGDHHTGCQRLLRVLRRCNQRIRIPWSNRKQRK